MKFLCFFIFIATSAFSISVEFSKHLKEQFALRHELEQAQKYLCCDDSQIDSLMQGLAFDFPFLRLESFKKNYGFEIDGDIGKKIKSVSFKSKTGILDRYLENVKLFYIGQVDNFEAQESILKMTKEALEEEGFPNIKISISIYEDLKYSYYTLNVDEGRPCRIRSLNFIPKLPKTFELEINLGDLCQPKEIQKTIRKLEDELRDEGYKNTKLFVKEYTLSEDKFFADIEIDGIISRKVKFNFLDSENSVREKKLNKNEIDQYDFHSLSPEVVPAELVKYYKSIGYEDVIVEGPSEESSDDTLVTTYKITPGSVYTIEELTFFGNKSFSESELLDVMNLSSVWNNKSIFNREKVNDGIDAVVSLYEKAGYWDIKVQNPQITKNLNSIKILILIKEGEKRILQSLKLIGTSPAEEQDLKSAFNLNFGNPIDKNRIIEAEKTIKDYFFRKGFVDVLVHTKLDVGDFSKSDSSEVPTQIEFDIERNKQFFIGRIAIDGLIYTDESLINREILFKADDPYDPQVISESRTLLLNLGIFNSVQIFPQKSRSIGDREIMDIRIELKEGDRGQLSFGPGYNLSKGFHYSTEFSFNNLMGKARKVSVRSAFSEEKDQESISNRFDKKGKQLLGRKIGAGFTEPYVFDLPVSGNLSIFHKATADYIWKFSNHFEASLNHRLSSFMPGGVVSPFYNLRFNRDEGNAKQEDALIATGNSRIGALGMRFKLDRRDRLSWPTQGFIFDSELQWARYEFGGDIKFFKWDVTTSFFRSFFSQFIGALSVSLASYENVESLREDPVLPSSERLLAGGESRVRGFAHQLGPYVRTSEGVESPFGATHRVILKSELRRQFVPNLFGGSLFMDFGNSFYSQDEIKVFENRFQERTETGAEAARIEDNYSYHLTTMTLSSFYAKNYFAAGTAANILTPIGPINIALAWPLHEPQCESSGACFQRARNEDLWIKRYKIELNIGSEF